MDKGVMWAITAENETGGRYIVGVQNIGPLVTHHKGCLEEFWVKYSDSLRANHKNIRIAKYQEVEP
jgi:hypothetical protein